MKLRILGAVICAVVRVAAEERAIDVQKSSMTVHVFKAGLLSVLAHDHWIAAPITAGTYNETGEARIAFQVDAAKMTVKPDPKVSEKDEKTIQKDMHEMTLESAKFPSIAFRSTSIVKSGAVWKVEGTLTLHGVSKTVRLDVRKNGDAYAGRTRIKQTEFGIKPVSVAGGTVKVKDELEIDFEIR